MNQCRKPHSKLLLATLIQLISCNNAEVPTSGLKVAGKGFEISGIAMVAPVKPMNDSALNPLLQTHANSISLMPYAFCNIETFTVQYNSNHQWWGEGELGVAGCVKAAHKNNLSVIIKPHLWIGRGMYTGHFSLQSNSQWQAWENSYSKYILRYAAIADSMKAEMFCIGTELGASVSARPQFWLHLIDNVKKVYNGKITYAANWDDYEKFPFWKKLDYIGVDAYFPLSTASTPEIMDIKKGWINHLSKLEQVSNQNGKKILFTEYGYRNEDRCTAEPWKENNGPLNNTAQANAYQALYETFTEKEWFAGGYVWKWYIDKPRHGFNKPDYTPQYKPALDVIKAWYSQKP